MGPRFLKALALMRSEAAQSGAGDFFKNRIDYVYVIAALEFWRLPILGSRRRPRLWGPLREADRESSLLEADVGTRGNTIDRQNSKSFVI